MNYERPELLDKLAGLYVLGTMSARARARFARLLGTSPAAQRAVAEWYNKLAPLNGAVAPLAPPRQIWDGIAARTRPAPAPAPPLSWRERIGQSLGYVARHALAFGLGGVLVAAVLSQQPGAIGLQAVAVQTPPSYVGLLTDADGTAILAASSLRRGKILTVKLLKPIVVPAGSVARLWALPKDGPPVAIANVPASGSARITLDAPAESMFFNVPQLAVSIEPAPGASSPSTPFVLTGHCVKFW